MISYTEYDKETIISRRDYVAVYCLDMSRLKVDLWSVIDKHFTSSCKSAKKWAQKYATSFFRIRPFILHLSRRWSRQRDILLLRRHENNHQCIFPLFSPVSFFSWSIKRWLFKEWKTYDLDMKTEVVPLDRDTWREDDDSEKNYHIHLFDIRVERCSSRCRHENMLEEDDESWRGWSSFNGRVQYITLMDTYRSWFN